MNIKATYIAPTIRIHKLLGGPIMGFKATSGGNEEAESKSAFADFGDPSDEAPSSSWDNSTY